MEFWGVELKGDKPVKVDPGVNKVVHLLQATLAELKKGSDPVTLYAKVGDLKLAIGVLSADATPHLSLGLVFEKEFELSHNWKHGSVHLTGYESLIPDEVKGVFSDGVIPLEEKPGIPFPAATRAEPAAKTGIKLEDIHFDDEVVGVITMRLHRIFKSARGYDDHYMAKHQGK